MQQKNKILHFHPDGLFASKFVWPLIECEREAGFSSNLVVSENSFNFGTTCIPFNLNFKNLLFLFANIIRIYKLILLEKPNIIISHNSRSSFLVLLCAWVAKVPKRIYFNHGVPYVGYRGIFRYLLMIVEFLNLSFSNNVITVSIDMVTFLQRLKKKISINIINNGSACGLDLSQYEEKNYLNSTFRYEYKIKSDDFVVVYLGRPVKRKGFNLMLEIWKKYLDDKNLKLVLCGPSNSDVLNILGYLPDNVVALGFTTRVPEILSQSDCLILPSLHEGLSYATLEAMASRCIVVANNIPGIRCLVESNINGFLIDDNALEKYVEILLNLSTNSKAYNHLIRSKAINASKKFSREIFLKSYLKYLNEIILANK